MAGLQVSHEGRLPHEERTDDPDQPHYCFSRELVHEVVQHFNLSGKVNIVDLTVGSGAMAWDFFQKLPHAQITSVDPTIPPFHKPGVVERLWKDFFQKNWSIRCADPDKTRLPDETFDLAVIGQAFSEMKFVETQREVRRLLKPGRGAAIFYIHGCDRACTGLEEFLFELGLGRPSAPTAFMYDFWQLIRDNYRSTLSGRKQMHEADKEDPDCTAYQQEMRNLAYMKLFFLPGRCTVKTVYERWGKYNLADLKQLCLWTDDEDEMESRELDPNYRKDMLRQREKMERTLRRIFRRNQVDGRVDFYHYVTVFYGVVRPTPLVFSQPAS